METFFRMPYTDEKGVWKIKAYIFSDRGVNVTQMF